MSMSALNRWSWRASGIIVLLIAYDIIGGKILLGAVLVNLANAFFIESFDVVLNRGRQRRSEGASFLQGRVLRPPCAYQPGITRTEKPRD